MTMNSKMIGILLGVFLGIFGVLISYLMDDDEMVRGDNWRGFLYLNFFLCVKEGFQIKFFSYCLF